MRGVGSKDTGTGQTAVWRGPSGKGGKGARCGAKIDSEKANNRVTGKSENFARDGRAKGREEMFVLERASSRAM